MNSTEINTLNRSTTINTPNNSATFTTANRSTTVTETYPAVSTGLAVIGFIALVAAGIWLAVYSSRYVPAVVNGAGEAAVYLGSVFTRSPASLSVVPTASSTTSSTTASSTATSTSTNVGTGSSISTPVTGGYGSGYGYGAPTQTTPGPRTGGTYVIGGTGTSPVLTGLPDLITTIKAVGYLAAASADSFIATTTVPAGSRAAVSFTIRNVGTNSTGAWCFSASIPTQTAYIYQSQPQQSLNPGDSIDYTLGFDQANRGAGQTISISANIANPSNTGTCAQTITESNANNNSASATLTILGT